MAHIIETIYRTSIVDTIVVLEQTHQLIVDCAVSSQKKISNETISWGINTKRLEVSLPYGELQIGKSNEKFVEIINILATTERTISALKWLAQNFPRAIVQECHPSTSDNPDGNDIVLIDHQDNILARCEVCDVASSNASQNKKETKDLKNLGCENSTPNDLVRRFIATSKEFALALSSPKRKWDNKHYKYITHLTKDIDQTILLEIVSR